MFSAGLECSLKTNCWKFWQSEPYYPHFKRKPNLPIPSTFWGSHYCWELQWSQPETQATGSYKVEKDICKAASSGALCNNGKGYNFGVNSIHSAELSNQKVQGVRSFPTRSRKKLKRTAEWHSSQKADHGPDGQFVNRGCQPHSSHFPGQTCHCEVLQPQPQRCPSAKPLASGMAPESPQ